MNNITAFDFKANVSQKVNKSEFVILNEDNEDVADEIDQNALRAAMESELAEMQEKGQNISKFINRLVRQNLAV